jgi:hypothetical protein
MIICACNRAGKVNCNDDLCSKHKEIKPSKTYYAPWRVNAVCTGSLRAAIDYANSLNWGDEDK